ncbi:CRISPR-associated endoribonuclease Cas6 [Algoriphagus ratkowskyi]|uniref:CRISPR-associated endoribonuclease n=1 Tax=Algoriphagus ratkowskyi TaxID=57028 RepID=A0A2W7R014_9BACT|nr:CRISPR-associated endoribonuclease Cas6 [Algoriphagus ratkowskyi]PZX51580.1 CRISPR-associated endoribonuclease Cas6 [Algoriphagus ratkowskyi]TXD78855.1 CRISPR-associated endoribonuclease Cas6 [Algoriphagus ratkowskyi]
MRFKLILHRSGIGKFIPINYQYELSSAIYRIIDQSNSDFASFLHEVGYRTRGKPFRLFTFSRLFFKGFKVHVESGRIEHYGHQVEFEVSFLVDRIAEEFIKGLFLGQEIFLGDQISGTTYQVQRIEAKAKPMFKQVMQYRCLSPILVKRKRISGGEDYLSPDVKGYSELILENLLSKSIALSMSFQNEGNSLAEDRPQIGMSVSGKIYKNGVIIKQLTPQQTKLIGYSFEFELNAPAELQEIGYYAGFGNLGSQGFGCVEVKS